MHLLPMSAANNQAENKDAEQKLEGKQSDRPNRLHDGSECQFGEIFVIDPAKTNSRKRISCGLVNSAVGQNVFAILNVAPKIWIRNVD